MSKKLLLIGETAGKSSLVEKLTTGNFSDVYNATIGVSATKNFLLGENRSIDIWDCSGNPNNQGLGDAYYVGGDCFVVVFRSGDYNSFKAAQRSITNASNTSKKIAIICCITDIKANQDYTLPWIQDFCTKNNYPYFETSAKLDSQEKIYEIFDKLYAFWFEGKYQSIQEFSMVPSGIKSV